jgi:hypothetical protein
MALNDKPPPRPIVDTNDIEHVVVRDDPRKWSSTRKVGYCFSALEIYLSKFLPSESYFIHHILCEYARGAGGQHTKSCESLV